MLPSPLSPSTPLLLPTPSNHSSPPILPRLRRRFPRRLKLRLLRRPRSTPLWMLRRSPFRSDRSALRMLTVMRTAVPSRNRIGMAFVCHSAPVAFLVCGKRGWGTFCFSAALCACCVFQMGEDEGRISEKTRCDGGRICVWAAWHAYHVADRMLGYLAEVLENVEVMGCGSGHLARCADSAIVSTSFPASGAPSRPEAVCPEEVTT